VEVTITIIKNVNMKALRAGVAVGMDIVMNMDIKSTRMGAVEDTNTVKLVKQ
jgi:hypothetical protein